MRCVEIEVRPVAGDPTRCMVDGWSDHDRVDSAGDHFINQRDLPSEIAFVFDAVDDEVVVSGVIGLMCFGPVRHRGEELVGE